MSLRRLSYRSIRALGLNDESLLRELIAPAQVRNRFEGITGCLWVGQHSFVQVIEGDEAAVHALMTRIVNDPRHSRLTVLSSTQARVRLFDSWSLKWVRQIDCKQIEGLAEAAAAYAPPLPSGRPLAPIRGFWEPKDKFLNPVLRIIGDLACAEATLY